MLPTYLNLSFEDKLIQNKWRGLLFPSHRVNQLMMKMILMIWPCSAVGHSKDLAAAVTFKDRGSLLGLVRSRSNQHHHHHRHHHYHKYHHHKHHRCHKRVRVGWSEEVEPSSLIIIIIKWFNLCLGNRSPLHLFWINLSSNDILRCWQHKGLTQCPHDDKSSSLSSLVSSKMMPIILIRDST